MNEAERQLQERQLVEQVGAMSQSMAQPLHSFRSGLDNSGFYTSHRQGGLTSWGTNGMWGTDPINVATAALEPNPYSIEEIHEAFSGRAEEVLKEAKEIINGTRTDELADRYRKLGFKKIKRVVENEQARIDREFNEKRMQTVMDYRVKYPSNQFLFNEDLNKLCEKYGLVHASSEYFNQDIPVKNLEDIEKFELKEDDVAEGQVRARGASGGEYMTKEVADAAGYVYEEVTKGNDGFEVVATRDMFDVPSGKVWEGNTLVEAPKYDPIVLKKVQGGFLIVTMWGPEAEFPEVNINNQ